jgi:Bacterial protein of unknown function (Gcw_chp)
LIAAPRSLAASGWLWAGALALLWPSAGHCQSESPFGGNLAITSDYIYRGVSESDGHGALQADLHAGSSGGTFGGVWASTRDRDLEPGTPAEVQAYLGQRFSLGAEWSAMLSGRSAYFVGGPARHSDDYQEISAALTWLDRYTLSVTAIPNAMRYSSVVVQYPGYQLQYYDVYRSAAFVADGAGQWLLRQGFFGGGLYLTAAAGYYYASRPGSAPAPGLGYLYGNGGLTLAWRRWRIDFGYFATQHRAARLFPYPVANRLAATVSLEY